MKIVERKLVRGDWYVEGGCFYNQHLWICSEVLSAMFEIPHWVKTIWLSLHDMASPNRCSAKVKKDYGGFFLLFEEDEFADNSLDKILKPFVGKTVHLQCEYMA